MNFESAKRKMLVTHTSGSFLSFIDPLNGFRRRLAQLIVTLIIIVAIGCSTDSNWQQYRRDSAGIAPDPATNKEAIVLFYGADLGGMRGWFAIHTWIAVKPTNETTYTVYDVVGWREYRGRSVLSIQQDIPDRHWFGSKPKLLREYRGEGVDDLIIAIDAAARAYPWQHTYDAFPGPNSNTFVAWVLNNVPELDLVLPWSAIGSGYVD